MSRALDLNSINAAIPQLSTQPPESSMGNHEAAELFGTTTFGIKIRGMVILAAESLLCHLNGSVARENAVKLEWLTDSIFVVWSGCKSYSTKIIGKIRNMCKEDTRLSTTTIEAIVELLVKESNEELSTILSVDDASTLKWSFTVGGRLHSEKDCKLFLVGKQKGLQSFVSLSGNKSGSYFPINGRGKDFFTKDIEEKIVEAHEEYDRALLSEIVKGYIAECCVNDESSGGRVTMVTIDDRGFHLFESADLIDPKDPSKGYKASEFDEFYPVGYRTG